MYVPATIFCRDGCPGQTGTAVFMEHSALLYECIEVCMYSMYVCIYVCMYLCMYICMYVCMYVYMYACMKICIWMCMCILSRDLMSSRLRNYTCEDETLNSTEPVWPYICMYIYVCMYVCIGVYVMIDQQLPDRHWREAIHRRCLAEHDPRQDMDRRKLHHPRSGRTHTYNYYCLYIQYIHTYI